MILISYGTRPEYIKLKPLIKKFDGVIPIKTVFTGQQMDIVDKNTDYILNIREGDNRLDSIVQSILNNDYLFEDIDYVLVHGDTTSAMAVAIAAFHRKIKIIHLEAGLRTYDIQNPYPEEFNRQMIDKLSSILLCPTENNKNNLIDEKCNGDIYVVGNTIIDNLTGYNNKCGYNNKVLITLHRRENHNDMDKWFSEISKIALENKDLEFIIPIHPNPNVYKHKNLLKGINVIKPLKYDEMLKEISECCLVISDSGGIQEEVSYFNKKVIVCRKVTERPETLGSNSILCKTYDELYDIFNSIKNNFEIDAETPYGDGKTSDRILKIMKEDCGYN